MKYGVESLNQIARDMYRGPKGIDSFVQYMELGGEVALGEPLALLNVGYDSSAIREKILKETGVDINTIAEEEGVDPEIFARLIFKESGGNPNAEGDDGKAQGYLQLHAAAAEEVGVERSDPVQNLVGGARYLKKNLDRFGGDYEKALQAYNAGPTRVARGNVPETTLAYASSILGSGPREKTPPVDQTIAAFRPDTPEFVLSTPVDNPGSGPVVIQEPSLDTVATVNRLEVPEFIREAQEPIIQASAVFRPEGTRDPGSPTRQDGSTKSETGFLGPIVSNDGRVMTELSTDMEVDGVFFEIPTLVPGLTEEQIEYLKDMTPGAGFDLENPMERSIVETAREHARKRLVAGKSPFYDDDLDGVEVSSREGVASLSEPIIQTSAVFRPEIPEPSFIPVDNPGGGPIVTQEPSFETVAAVNRPEIPEPIREAIAMVSPDTPSGIGSMALGDFSKIFTQQETPRLKPSKITVRGPSGSRMAPPGMGTLPEMSMQGLDAFRELYQETTPYKRTPLKPSA